jgi:uncharacterized protein YndB with AHSA1/START domain
MSPTGGNGTIVKEIAIKAPADRVFEALTDPLQRVKWWGVEGKFQVTEMESDLRPGGAWLMRGVGMGGKPFTIRGEYRAIDRPRLLEFTWLPDWQESQTLVRFDLEEKDGATTVRLIHSGLTSEHFEKYQGWPWLLALLRAYVEAKVAD